METSSASDKTEILLKVLEHQTECIEKGEEYEQRFFQWSTSLMLAAFGAIVALSDKSQMSPFPVVVKSLATVMIVVPVILSSVWIFRRSKRSVRPAEAVERIEKLLHLFEDGYYGSYSPYPQTWEGKLVNSRRSRKTPFYYVSVMVLMLICVVATIWLIL